MSKITPDPSRLQESSAEKRLLALQSAAYALVFAVFPLELLQITPWALSETLHAQLLMTFFLITVTAMSEVTPWQEDLSVLEGAHAKLRGVKTPANLLNSGAPGEFPRRFRAAPKSGPAAPTMS